MQFWKIFSSIRVSIRFPYRTIDWELHYLLNWLDDKIFLNKKEAENDLWSAASSKLSEQVEVQR